MSSNINNRIVCILAHVDHGKTSLLDNLLVEEQLVSAHAAGRIRYMDDRVDEQQRGITMKSSSVTVKVPSTQDTGHRLLTVIDTPGHLDLATEVLVAARISDGALILVDVIEGVKPQTKQSIKTAFEQGIGMILVINKIDRLFLDLLLPAKAAFKKIWRVVEIANVYLAQLQIAASNMETRLDVNFRFSMVDGTVVFASGIDGWAFTTRNLALAHAKHFSSYSIDDLNEIISDCDKFWDKKLSQFLGGVQQKDCTNVFAQLGLAPIQSIYKRIVAQGDTKFGAQYLSSRGITPAHIKWLEVNPTLMARLMLSLQFPLTNCIADQCYAIFPPPGEIRREKLDVLLDHSLSQQRTIMKECSKNGPLLGYVTKLIVTNMRDITLQFLGISLPKPRRKPQDNTTVLHDSNTKEVPEAHLDNHQDQFVVVALTRLYSGSVKKGAALYFLNEQYDPTESSSDHATGLTVDNIYEIKGSKLHSIHEAEAGQAIGITFVSNNVFRSGTITDNLKYAPFIEKRLGEPIMQFIVEPEDPNTLPELQTALKLLKQSDSAIEILMTEHGEHILCTAGEVHLEKCMADLQMKFTDIKIHLSDPSFSLRETVAPETSWHETACFTKFFNVHIAILPMPKVLIETVMFNKRLLVSLHKHHSPTDIHIKELLEAAFKTDELWKQVGFDNIWCVGDTDYANLLINTVDNSDHDVLSEQSNFDAIIVETFQRFIKVGPICSEPIVNCGIFICKFELEHNEVQFNVNEKNECMRNLMNGFHNAFRCCVSNIMEPILRADIDTNITDFGKVEEVVRHFGGSITDVETDDDEKTYFLEALIPAVKATEFVNKVRDHTSGTAHPQFSFSHYQAIDINVQTMMEPPTDEDEEFSKEKAQHVLKLINAVRKRKGLPLMKQVVEHAEKQRTLSKKK